jgi:hypothetical protein
MALKDGQLYCAEHARGVGGGKLGPANCMGCSRPISAQERVLPALNGKWHPQCFVCEQCQKPLENKQVVVMDGKPYCEQDYESLFRTNCASCGKPVGAQVLEIEGDAGKVSYHPTCFRCATCNKSLKGIPFFLKGKEVYCEKDAQ